MSKITIKVFVSLLILIIFFIDITTHPGIALSILYIIPVSIGFNESKKTVLFFAFVCCILTIIDDVVYFNTKMEFNVFIDSILAIMGIVLSSLATIKYKALKDKSERRKKENMKAILEMLFSTSHRLRQPITAIQGLNIFLHEKDLSKQELLNISFYLKDSITKLDLYSKELTDFLTKIRKEGELDI